MNTEDLNDIGAIATRLEREYKRSNQTIQKLAASIEAAMRIKKQKSDPLQLRQWVREKTRHLPR